VSNSRTVIVLVTLAGVLLLVVAGIYFAEPAQSLPAFFPGHVGSNSSEVGHHHVKHGIAAFVVALGAFAFAWFASGPRSEVTYSRDAQT
jgi:hypothetical protein